MLTPSKAPFNGIIPGNAATPIGSVTLPVTFGTKENYCMEYIAGQDRGPHLPQRLEEVVRL
jgi:hypothetical protein